MYKEYCQYCKGNPPNRIGMFVNSDGNHAQPMRYKMCDHCEKVDTFNYLDRFYNSTISRIMNSYFWKVVRSEENSQRSK